jgi:hypothetical protein
VSERTRGLLVLFAAAAVGGIYLGVTRKPTVRDAPLPPPPSASGAPEVPAPRRATRPEARALAKRLGNAVRAPAGDPKSAWALAHGMVAFGPSFAAADGRPASDVIVSFRPAHHRG